jgi:hypothetical protein
MDVVLRPANDKFLLQVVFPALELGIVDAVPAIEHLIQHVGDETIRINLEILLDNGVDGSFFGLENDKWSTAVYQLLFNAWRPDKDGWKPAPEQIAYAGDWEDTLHLSLMLEDEAYPYFDDEGAKRYRQTVATSSFASESGLASLTCGFWDPLPSFPPDQILTVQGQGDYRPKQGVVRADWSWRPVHIVNQWAAQLPNMLSRLLEREARRLKPVEAPEKHDVLQYWLGRIEKPPVLAVTFSGLGPKAHEWIRELGQLARMVRQVAAQQQGLTAVITHRGEEDLFGR